MDWVPLLIKQFFVGVDNLHTNTNMTSKCINDLIST